MSLLPIISKIYHHPLTSHFTRWCIIPSIVTSVALIYFLSLQAKIILRNRTNKVDPTDNHNLNPQQAKRLFYWVIPLASGKIILKATYIWFVVACISGFKTYGLKSLPLRIRILPSDNPVF